MVKREVRASVSAPKCGIFYRVDSCVWRTRQGRDVDVDASGACLD